MISTMSTMFVRTLRDDPADAELPGHRLLIRAGYVRRAAPGVYSWLPLGLRVRRKVEDIVRREMNAIGAQEMLFPALVPKEPYELTNRWTEYGENAFRCTDRKGAEYMLGPTHEELFTLAVKDVFSSYKDLPVSLYQIQDKYRDEARPRGGLLRGREFTMKDSYSFDVAKAGLDKSYAAHRQAYINIFDQLGFEYVIVQAVSGAMGGSHSEEFLAVSPHGEDTFVTSSTGEYAANVEAVRVAPAEPQDASAVPAAQVHDTPDTPTIDTLVACFNANHPRTDGSQWTADHTLKNVMLMVHHPDGTTEPVAVGVPGDREVEPKRLEAHFEPAVAAPFTDADFKNYPDLVVGYIGPAVLGEKSATGIKYLVDPRVVDGTAWITGANEAGKHVQDLVVGRDFTPDGVLDVATIKDGDPAMDGGTLRSARGIEMGHIFQLGTKYSDALGLKVLDENGKLVPVEMGSYGIGVTRAVATVAEENCDDLGLVWPRNLAPFDVHVVAAGKGAELLEAATRLSEELDGQGLEVLLDDRPKVSPGVKFKDSELIGIPTILVVGKGYADGKVEVKDRAAGTKMEVPVTDAVQHIVGLTTGTASNA